MPIEYSIDEVNDLLVTTVTGVVSDADILAYMHRLIADPLYRTGMDGVAYTDAIEKFEVTADAISEASRIATESEHRFTGSRWALVATRDPVFGMSRMFELRRDPESYEVRVFREEGPALAWLADPEAETREPSPPRA